MSKSFLYRLFGLRKVSTEIRNRLEAEVLLFDEEGTSCALAYKKFRGTHKQSGRGWETGATGSLLISQRSFYVKFPYMIMSDKPSEVAARYIELELDGNQKLIMKFNVENLFEDSTGNLTCYWRTENARAIFDHIRNIQKRHTMKN